MERGTDLSRLVEQESLQGIVTIELQANPLRCPPIENYKWTGLPEPLPNACGEIEPSELEQKATQLRWNTPLSLKEKVHVPGVRGGWTL